MSERTLSHVKLPALKGGASREGISFYIVPLDPALKGGACGALAGQGQPPIRNSSIFNIPFFLKLDRYGYFVVYYKIALTIL